MTDTPTPEAVEATQNEILRFLLEEIAVCDRMQLHRKNALGCDDTLNAPGEMARLIPARIADLERQLAEAQRGPQGDHHDAMDYLPGPRHMPELAGDKPSEVREALAAAFIAGATAVHEEWHDSHENGTGTPPGQADFSEAAMDYAAALSQTEGGGDG